jgi:hypothetical protein
VPPDDAAELVQHLLSLLRIGGDVRVQPGQSGTYRTREQHVFSVAVEIGTRDKRRTELDDLIPD